MPVPLAADYAAIAARMREITNEEPEFEEPEFCTRCENGGWVCSHHPTNGQPIFRECEICHNPEDHPCP